MKIDIKVEQTTIIEATKEAVKQYVKTTHVEKLIEKTICKKLMSTSGENKIDILIKNAISRTILTLIVKNKTIEKYSLEDLDVRISDILMKIIENSESFQNTIRKVVKNTIKIY